MAGYPPNKRKLTPNQVAVLQGLDAGKTRKEIEIEYGIDPSTIRSSIVALEKYGYNFKEEKRETKFEKIKKQVLEEIKKSKKTRREISEITGIHYSVVCKAVRELLKSGTISADDLETRKIEKAENGTLTKKQQIVFDAIKKGMSRKSIRDEFDIEVKTFEVIIKSLKNKGLLSEQEAVIANLTDNQINVLNGIKEGKTRSEIAGEYGISLSTVCSCQNALIRKKIVDIAQINLRTILKLSDFQNRLLKDLKAGRNRKEIAEAYGISYKKINGEVNKLVNRGIIKREDIVCVPMGRKVDKSKLEKSVLENLKKGKSRSDIAAEYRLAYATVWRISDKLIKSGKISEAEMYIPPKGRKSTRLWNDVKQVNNYHKKVEVSDTAGKRPIKENAHQINRRIAENKTNPEIKPQIQAESIAEKRKDKNSQKRLEGDCIKQLKQCLKNGETPSKELVNEVKTQTLNGKKNLDTNLIGIVLRGYSARKEALWALTYINECRKFLRDRAMKNPALEEKFGEIEIAISKGIKEKQAIKNMRWGASIHDSANDAGISEKRATELYNKYVKPTKEIGGQEEIPQYEIEF